MKGKTISLEDDKKHMFSTYFVIKDRMLLDVCNFNYEDSLSNCFYVRKLGSNIKPKIYLDIKKDNEWIEKNIPIGNYNDFMKFILQNDNTFICIRGFSREGMFRFIRLYNELVDMDIKIVRFNRTITDMQYEKYFLEKEEKKLKMQQRREKIQELEKIKENIATMDSRFLEDNNVRKKY